MAKWQEFERCPHCGLDFGTGEGDRACSWGACAYLPEELDVCCEQCGFNFYTMEGNPPCPDQLACEHSPGPLEHLENYRRWLEARPTAATAP